MIRYEIVLNEDTNWPIDSGDLEYMEAQLRYILKYSDGVSDFSIRKIDDDVTI